jgi:hypothetical protein
MLSMGLMFYPSMLGSLSIKSNVCLLLATARRLKRNSISEKNRTTY